MGGWSSHGGYLGTLVALVGVGTLRNGIPVPVGTPAQAVA